MLWKFYRNLGLFQIVLNMDVLQSPSSNEIVDICGDDAVLNKRVSVGQRNSGK